MGPQVSPSIRFAQRAVDTPYSGIREIVHRAIDLQEQGRDVIRLEVGEAAWSTPRHIIEQAHADALAGQTRYTASAGQASLRQAICEKLARVNGLSASPDNVVITVGAVQALWLALAALCNPSDEVLIPDPGWPNYAMILTMLGIRARTYLCAPRNGFMPDPAEIAAAIGPRTRALVVNSPQNPSGVVYPRSLVEALAAVSANHNLVIISDEAYDELYLNSAPVSPTILHPVESGRWVAAFSFSKTYAMTGWRVGYLVASAPLASLVTKLQEPTVSCVSSISQRAASAALRGPQEFVRRVREDLGRRRDIVLGRLKGTGRVGYIPQGAFYILVDVRPQPDREFAFRLLDQAGVAVAPGSAFGDAGRGHVRICYAAGGERLPEAIDRMAALLPQ